MIIFYVSKVFILSKNNTKRWNSWALKNFMNGNRLRAQGKKEKREILWNHEKYFEQKRQNNHLSFPVIFLFFLLLLRSKIYFKSKVFNREHFDNEYVIRLIYPSIHVILLGTCVFQTGLKKKK